MSMSERPVVVAKYEALMQGRDVHIAKKLVNVNRRQSAMQRKLKLGGVSKIQKSRKLAHYFWNYNTVESTMLFCANMILIAGLMFQSKGIKPHTLEMRALLYGTMTIIFASSFYFICVLMTEILTGLGCLDCLMNMKFKKKKKSPMVPSTNEFNDVVFQENAYAGRNMMKNNPLMGKETVEMAKEKDFAIENLQKEVANLKRKQQAQALKSYAGNSKRQGKKKNKKAFDLQGLAREGSDRQEINL